MLSGNVLITGSGFLATAIVKRSVIDKWDCQITIYSRDPVKHHKIQSLYPQCKYIVGDVCDLNSLSKSFVGQDIVVHTAALKHIPECESNPEETMRVNYGGTRNVARAALEARVKKVVNISTDKSAHPINIYGISKLAGERLLQKYDSYGLTEYFQTRYGNILQSTGSVLTVWKQMLERDGFVTATDPHMSRFWMSIDQAVDCVLASLNNLHGTITIPKCKALDMRTFARYTIPGVNFLYNGLRPGEKRYEELITREESPFVNLININPMGDYFTLYPIVGNTPPESMKTGEYRSDNCEQLTKEELEEMLK